MGSKATRERNKRWRDSQHVAGCRQKRKGGYVRFCLWLCARHDDAEKRTLRGGKTVPGVTAASQAHAHGGESAPCILDSRAQNPSGTQREIHDNKNAYKTKRE